MIKIVRRVVFEWRVFMVLPPPAETENTPELPHHEVEALLASGGGLM
jgi:hypothetical protein